MNTSMKIPLVILAIALPSAAFAQSSDANYCKALVSEYEQYLDMSSKKGQQPQGLDARSAVEKCKVGDAAGIPGIEKALQDAKYSLPSRTATAVPSAAKASNCGGESWSTEKMAYVGIPCPQ